MFIASLEELVPRDSWARIVDLFVDAMPMKDFGFENMELNKEETYHIIQGIFLSCCFTAIGSEYVPV